MNIVHRNRINDYDNDFRQKMVIIIIIMYLIKLYLIMVIFINSIYNQIVFKSNIIF